MYKRFGKRFLDFIFALAALPFLLVVLVVIGLIIYLEDRGPIFYCGPRRGKNGRVFRMYKLRSMKVNAPDIRNEDGSTFGADDDPRVTRIGRLIRKTSIDELPQILNVLKGDMSFVGPRPALATRPYEELGDLSKARLAVRPGITGYAQACYRNSIAQEEKFKYDCYYIDNISFVMDVKILLRTTLSVLSRKNVYGVTNYATTRAKTAVETTNR